MARFDNVVASDTEADTLTPDVIVPEIMASSANIEVMMNLVRRFDFTGRPGETFAVNQAPTISFGAHTEGDAVAEDAFTATARTITPLFRVVDVIVSKKTVMDAVSSLQDAIVAEGGIALATDRDTLALALYTEAPASTPDHEIEVSVASYAHLVDASVLLYTQRCPRPFSYICHPNSLGEYYQDTTIKAANVVGKAMITEGIGANGLAFQLLDVNVYSSPDVTLSTTYFAIMMAPGAMGYGFKMMDSPNQSTLQELLVDIEWNSGRRSWEINMTYDGDFEGLRDTSTTNKWMVAVAVTAV